MYIYDKIKQKFQSLLIDGSIRHISGPLQIGEDKRCILICLVRNGEAYIHDFLKHYQKLGVDHFFFLDNGSEDATVEYLSRCKNSTVLQSSYFFGRDGDVALRNYMIEKFGKGRWSLVADIDEFFSYPYCNVISFSQFLEYLDSADFDAVACHLLDMYPQSMNQKEFVRGDHSRYRIQCVVQEPLQRQMISTVQRRKGGVRTELFGIVPDLTKFSLIRYHGAMFRTNHEIYRAHIADCSCVFLHYKFTPDFAQKAEIAVREKNHWKDSYEYKAYWETVRMQGLHFPKGRKLIDTEQLVDEGFLDVSDAYTKYVRSIAHSS